MTPTGTFDSREFDAALREYYIHYGKDVDYTANRQALNVAIKAAQSTPLADTQAIEALPSKDWWPAYIAGRISKKGYKFKGRKRSTTIQGSYTRAQARRVSKAIVAGRKRRAGFVRSGWIPAMRIFTALKIKSRGRITGTNRIKNPPGTAIPARSAGKNAVAIIVNKAAAAVPVSGPALQKALNLAALDMRQFIAERFGATAKKFNR